MVSLDSCSLAHPPIALAVLWVVGLRTTHPRVVGDLVVIPDSNQRRGLGDRLQVHVGARECVAQPVVAQRQGLRSRLQTRPAHRLVGPRVRLLLTVLVEIVTHVQPKVEAAAHGTAARGSTKGVEVAPCPA